MNLEQKNQSLESDPTHSAASAADVPCFVETVAKTDAYNQDMRENALYRSCTKQLIFRQAKDSLILYEIIKSCKACLLSFVSASLLPLLHWIVLRGISEKTKIKYLLWNYCFPLLKAGACVAVFRFYQFVMHVFDIFNIASLFPEEHLI